jgi:hypothetical protein
VTRRDFRPRLRVLDDQRPARLELPPEGRPWGAFVAVALLLGGAVALATIASRYGW